MTPLCVGMSVGTPGCCGDELLVAYTGDIFSSALLCAKTCFVALVRNLSVLCDKQAADGKTGAKRALNPEEEAKKKKRMERFGIVDEKEEAAKRAEAEVRTYVLLYVSPCVVYVERC